MFNDAMGRLTGFWYHGRFRAGTVVDVRDIRPGTRVAPRGGKLVTVDLSPSSPQAADKYKSFYVHKMEAPAVYAD